MSTLTERWIAAIETAVELNTTAHHPDGLPAAIWHAITHADDPDDGLRAANYEARIRSSRGDSHPERMLNRHGPGSVRGKNRDGRLALIAGDQFWESIDAILGLIDPEGRGNTVDGLTATPATSWPGALESAAKITQLRVSDNHGHAGDWVEAQIDTSEDATPFSVTIGAVETLRRLALAWGVAHVATLQERLKHPDICLAHAAANLERPVCGRLVLCKTCRDLVAEHADVDQVHRLSENWPTPELLGALEGGRTTDYRRLRGEWLATHGVRSA